MHRPQRISWCGVFSLVVLATGCGNEEALSSQSTALISDANHSAGTPGFFLLDPLAPAPPSTFTGAFEPRLAPSVRIDRIDPRTGATAATPTTLTPFTLEKVRRNPSREFYIARWETARYDLHPRATYRVRVVVGNKELGSADVRVVTRGADVPGLAARQILGVVRGEILPIKFRVERDTVDADADGVFDWDDNCPAIANGPPMPLQETPLSAAPALGCSDRQVDCDPLEVDCLPSSKPEQSDTDGDGDGTGDACDACPFDPEKTAPALCGCGVSDVDEDNDGTPSCLDLCPSDAAKTAAGLCGCGIADTDTDGDGSPDCSDGCPGDAAKTAPGRCGCGTGEVDSDLDGTLDCRDECANDAQKVAAGTCGCGTSDVDTDGDGAPDCQDACASDPRKLSAGVCGCGTADVDTDLDAVADCQDGCRLDKAKTAPGLCGCGWPDVDTDGDATPDCRDVCPSDTSKVDPQRCGCGVQDTDSDGDGVLDCRDACPADAAKWQDSECRDPDAAAPPVGPSFVDITWMSISNVYYEMGPLNVLTDGYITRIPLGNFFGGGGGLAHTRVANKPDVAAVTQVLGALGGPTKVNLLLTGHSHFDHTFDTATWSTLTGAPIIAAKTTCFQARAQGVPADHCTPVNGGEKIVLGDGVSMWVVRWNHSGDAVQNPEQHNPVELGAVPVLDEATGGLHAGVADDFPNGGGGRGFLFLVNGPDGPFSWYFQNSAAAQDLSLPIVVDGVDYGAPLDNLKAAMANAGLDSVDLWIGTGGVSVAQLVVPVLKPKAYLPIHWDGLDGVFLAGVVRRYSDARLASFLTASGIKLLSPVQYMDKWRLDRTGVVPVANAEVKAALGFAN